jgi:hypothetical protein
VERFYIGAIMKDSIFDKEVTDMIIAKIKQDPTGKMAEVMQQIMDVCEEAGKRGFTMKELSIMATTGWFLSQSPELRGLLDNMMGLTPPSDNETWN